MQPLEPEMIVVAGEAIRATLMHEGGLVNNKNDLGGKTNLGITEGTLKSMSVASKGKKTIAEYYACPNVEYLTGKPNVARQIYIGEYFIPSKADALYRIVKQIEDAKNSKNVNLVAQVFASLHFDCAVNHGIGNATKFLQGALNMENLGYFGDLVVDGGFGAKTRDAVNKCLKRKPADRLYNSILAKRVAYYVEIVDARQQHRAFIGGWLRRVDHFHELKAKVWQ